MDRVAPILRCSDRARSLVSESLEEGGQVKIAHKFRVGRPVSKRDITIAVREIRKWEPGALPAGLEAAAVQAVRDLVELFDSRFTVTHEFTGHEEKHYVVRFSGKWQGSTPVEADAYDTATRLILERRGVTL